MSSSIPTQHLAWTLSLLYAGAPMCVPLRLWSTTPLTGPGHHLPVCAGQEQHNRRLALDGG